MRGLILSVWLLIPALLGAYHYGPGQTRMELDATQDSLRAARQCIASEDYKAAVEHFNDAISRLPKDRVTEERRIRVERAKAQMLARQLPAAYNELVVLVPELQANDKTDPKLLADGEAALASAKYYLTWLMRLEGKPRAEWEPEIDGSRQLYRLLAEKAREKSDDAQLLEREEDLEAAVRLARLDLSQLQALPLPSQCQGCCSGNCKGKGKNKNPNPSKSKSDARGASAGPPPDDHGN
ncbi:MAG TPA: hypothetical protein VGN12_20575 [Pirellulales bacterium]|jgi:chromosome segregation ATPase